jgi:L-arabinose isomerase
VLGAHMLEICPTIASSRPKIEVHRLGIGGKKQIQQEWFLIAVQELPLLLL